MRQLRDVLKDFFDQVRVARATELAGAKHYLEAESLLMPNGQWPLEPSELDLLGRISAQQRQYERARSFWESALQHAPGNMEYIRAIDRTIEAKRRQMLFRKGERIVLLIFVLAALFTIIWLGVRSIKSKTAFSRNILPENSARTPPPLPVQPPPVTVPPSKAMPSSTVVSVSALPLQSATVVPSSESVVSPTPAISPLPELVATPPQPSPSVSQGQ